MWDWEFDLGDMFGGGDLDFSELPMMDAPLFEMPLQMGPDVNLPDIFSNLDFGDNIDQGGGWNPGSGGGGLGGLSGLLSGAKGLGGLFGGGGGLDLMSILGLAGMIGGGLNANNATNKASDELKNAAKESNEFAINTIGGARDDFKPYMGAGTDALAGIQALLASPESKKKFAPLASHQMKPMKGSMTLAQLAAR